MFGLTQKQLKPQVKRNQNQNQFAKTFDEANTVLEDAKELLDMAQSEDDEDTATSVINDLSNIESSIEKIRNFERHVTVVNWMPIQLIWTFSLARAEPKHKIGQK